MCVHESYHSVNESSLLWSGMKAMSSISKSWGRTRPSTTYGAWSSTPWTSWWSSTWKTASPNTARSSWATAAGMRLGHLLHSQYGTPHKSRAPLPNNSLCRPFSQSVTRTVCARRLTLVDVSVWPGTLMTYNVIVIISFIHTALFLMTWYTHGITEGKQVRTEQ